MACLIQCRGNESIQVNIDYLAAEGLIGEVSFEKKGFARVGMRYYSGYLPHTNCIEIKVTGTTPGSLIAIDFDYRPYSVNACYDHITVLDQAVSRQKIVGDNNSVSYYFKVSGDNIDIKILTSVDLPFFLQSRGSVAKITSIGQNTDISTIGYTKI